jgi:protein involved in polysaccharide export with SLBB domain
MLNILLLASRFLLLVLVSVSVGLGASQPTERIIVVGDRAHGTREIPYSAGLTASKAIIAAGGYSDFSRTPIFLVRCGQLTRLDMRAILERGEHDKDVQLKPWDVIVIGLGIFRRE